MLDQTIISAVVAAYLGLLVFAGWWTSRRGAWGNSRRAIVYGLSLATLSTAWTFFGAVGDATAGSWLFLANASGPILAATLGYPAWIKIVRLAKLENSGSIADFMAARFGKNRTVGVIVALVACLAALPYMALQILVLKEVWEFVTGGPQFGNLQTFFLMAILIGLTIAFGARQPSLTHQNRGFVSMIALESLMKIAAIVFAAGVCLYVLAGEGLGTAAAVADLPTSQELFQLPFATLLILCTVTAFTLPRQFHLSFVTVEKVEDAKRGLWLFPAYFGLWAIATLIIANSIKGGLLVPDAPLSLQTLAIPFEHGMILATLVIFLGGLSAGAAMVIVELTALSAMVSNEIVLPLISAASKRTRGASGAGSRVLQVRRLSIIALGFLAWIFFLMIDGGGTPTQLGIIALAASAQLLPGLMAGIYWKRAHATGVLAGIAAGMAVWAFFVLLPILSYQPGAPALLSEGLWPTAVGARLEFIILASLAVNTLVLIVMSMTARPHLIDNMQAQKFVSLDQQNVVGQLKEFSATVGDLEDLLAQFVGESEARKALLNFHAGRGQASFDQAAPVTPAMAIMAEHVLAGAIGTTSARSVVAIALAVGGRDHENVRQLLDEAGQAVTFSRDLLQLTLDGLEHAVGVVDSDMRLVTWNRNFLALLGLKQEGVFVGLSVVAVPSRPHSAGYGSSFRDELERKISSIRRRRPFNDELRAADGRVLQFIGAPIADENYLMTVVDITDVREAERVLAQSKEELERRVEERTRELTLVNQELEHASSLAERATRAQRRFVAAASHDLVQPLHAARIFIGNVLAENAEDPKIAPVLSRADDAIEGAHRMLRALLSLSQLELGAITPKLQPVDASVLLSSLAIEFEGQAKAKGLELVYLPTSVWIRTDRDLLRSVLQNLIVNAIRYTQEGRIVLATRYAGDNIRIEVRDSGIGMKPERVSSAFGEFARLVDGQRLSEGTGLGLAIVARIVQVLGHEVKVRSSLGKGSVFSITVPRAQPRPPKKQIPRTAVDLQGLRVLCVDDELDILVGTEALISHWGGKVATATCAEGALALDGDWDVVLADYSLGAGMNGAELLEVLRSRTRWRALVTAIADEDRTDELAADVIVLIKPVSPLALQDFLLGCSRESQLDDLGECDSASN